MSHICIFFCLEPYDKDCRLTTENPETLQDLKNFCEDATSIKPEICQNAIQCFHERLQTCIGSGDSSVEK